MSKVKVILQPTDFSEPAAQARAAACEIAREQKARLVVLHVTAKPVVSYIEKTSDLPPEKLQQKLWETLRAPRECEAGVDVQHRVEEGSPVQQIVRVAKEIQADLIVLGAHGPRGPLKWFTSNVTDHIVRESPCSVLIVKDPPAEASPESEPARAKSVVAEKSS